VGSGDDSPGLAGLCLEKGGGVEERGAGVVPESGSAACAGIVPGVVPVLEPVVVPMVALVLR